MSFGLRLAAMTSVGALLGIGLAAPAGFAGVGTDAPVADMATPAVAARNVAVVQRIAQLDVRPQVRIAAWVALNSSDIDAAVADFLAPGGGYDLAKARAVQTAEMNLAIIDRVLATVTATSSPAVFTAASKAKAGTLAEQDAFVRTRWATAKAVDAANATARQTAIAAQAQADRDFVANIAAHATGPWVRSAAKRASEVGTSAALAAFFAYEWFGAAECDLQNDQLRLTDVDVQAHAASARLVAAAERAERAYLAADAATAAATRADAVAAWAAVAEQARSVVPDWANAEQDSREQAQGWAAVADAAALAVTEQQWAAIRARAEQLGAAWAELGAWAKTQATSWSDLAATAQANRIRLTTAG